ncbi:MAG: TetR/AcrR family transcriptional regulator [Acidobacteriota bacterium]|nr:TetR/AcrR family transcriptional regulator [Acidobacteriota bacterium]
MSKERKQTQSKKSIKFRQLVEAGRDLFWRYGIRRVSVEEICQASGVSKMTFYRYFDNKVDLALYIIKEMFREGEERYRDIISQKVPFSEKAREIIKMKLDISEGWSQEMMKELMQNTIPEITEFIDERRQENFKIFIEDLVSAQKKGDIRKDVRPEFILYFLNQVSDMVSDEQLINMYDSPKTLTAELINFFFYGILSKNRKGSK